MARSTRSSSSRSNTKADYDDSQLQALLYEALETENGGIEIYTQALQNTLNDDLHKEWTKYLRQTERHRDVLLSVFESLGLDPDASTPGREVVAHLGSSLVQAIQMARNDADQAAAEIVAAECVVLAETKDHLNWELIGHIARHGKGDAIEVLKAAHEEVEDEEDRHLYHTAGWARELWVDSLGLPAVLPPPEEVRDVDSKAAAAKAEQQRDRMM